MHDTYIDAGFKDASPGTGHYGQRSCRTPLPADRILVPDIAATSSNLQFELLDLSDWPLPKGR